MPFPPSPLLFFSHITEKGGVRELFGGIWRFWHDLAKVWRVWQKSLVEEGASRGSAARVEEAHVLCNWSEEGLLDARVHRVLVLLQGACVRREEAALELATAKAPVARDTAMLLKRRTVEKKDVAGEAANVLVVVVVVALHKPLGIDTLCVTSPPGSGTVRRDRTDGTHLKGISGSIYVLDLYVCTQEE